MPAPETAPRRLDAERFDIDSVAGENHGFAMKRLEHRPAAASDRVYVIAYDSRRYTITEGGRLIGDVVFDSDGKAGVTEGAVLVLARHHAERLAKQRRRWLRLGVR